MQDRNRETNKKGKKNPKHAIKIDLNNNFNTENYLNIIRINYLFQLQNFLRGHVSHVCFGGLALFWESLPSAFGLGRQGRGQELVRTGQLFWLFEWRMLRGTRKMVFFICWRGASSDADILKLSDGFRNARWCREAWKETKSSSGSFLVLEDLIRPLYSRSITWVQSRLFGPSSLAISVGFASVSQRDFGPPSTMCDTPRLNLSHRLPVGRCCNLSHSSLASMNRLLQCHEHHFTLH